MALSLLPTCQTTSVNGSGMGSLAPHKTRTVGETPSSGSRVSNNGPDGVLPQAPNFPPAVPMSPPSTIPESFGSVSQNSRSSPRRMVPYSKSLVDYPTLSVLPPLKNLSVLDIDRVAYLDELAVLVKRNQSVLKELGLSISAAANADDFTEIKGNQSLFSKSVSKLAGREIAFSTTKDRVVYWESYSGGYLTCRLPDRYRDTEQSVNEKWSIRTDWQHPFRKPYSGQANEATSGAARASRQVGSPSSGVRESAPTHHAMRKCL
ncbi:hypothetical protein G7046_g6509 [Stylonectria norvegica]|nr:hypothetical protein G7046_g6509 [Stylonectria norvegica]